MFFLPDPAKSIPDRLLAAWDRRHGGECRRRAGSVDGIEAMTAETILSGIGTDPSRFKTERHFVSWAGLTSVPGCQGRESYPPKHQTGGKGAASGGEIVVSRR